MTAHEVTFEETAAYVRGCATKLTFLSKADARRYAKRHDRRHHAGRSEPYSCPSCGAVHLSLQRRRSAA